MDLGCGGGLDSILAAQKVGSSGRVIGVDMTPEMVLLAREAARRRRLSNVEFHLAEVEQIPLGTATVDVVISNAVFCLVPDKDIVLAEALRVLKPGGRLAISDLVLMEATSGDLWTSRLWAGCIGYSIEKNAFLEKLEPAGLARIEVHKLVPWRPDDRSCPDLGWCQIAPSSRCVDLAEEPVIYDARDLVASIEITARKPA